jgi:hypothetical protein
MEDTSYRPTNQQLRWATVAAVLFVIAASVLVIPLFGRPSLSNSGGLFTIAILLSVALVGWVSWLGIERYSSTHPILGGVVAGVFTGVFAHPVAWFFGPIVGGAGSGGGLAFFLPLMSVWSLLLLVWITVPLGVIAGVVTGLLRVVLSRKRPSGDKGPK